MSHCQPAQARLPQLNDGAASHPLHILPSAQRDGAACCCQPSGPRRHWTRWPPPPPDAPASHGRRARRPPCRRPRRAQLSFSSSGRPGPLAAAVPPWSGATRGLRTNNLPKSFSCLVRPQFLTQTPEECRPGGTSRRRRAEGEPPPTRPRPTSRHAVGILGPLDLIIFNSFVISRFRF